MSASKSAAVEERAKNVTDSVNQLVSTDGSLASQLRYSRDEMLAVKNSPICNFRPTYLDTKFDNEDGKFQPEKWVEHIWLCDGVESRPTVTAKRREKAKVDSLEGECNVLCPQRRGFSLGCRAASPTKTDSEAPKKITGSKGSWRAVTQTFHSRSAPSFDSRLPSELVVSKRVKSTNSSQGGAPASPLPTRSRNLKDLRVSSSGSADGSWRNVNDRSNRQKTFTNVGVPEWLDDGPNSVHDYLDLEVLTRDVNQKAVPGLGSDPDIHKKTQAASLFKGMDRSELVSKRTVSERTNSETLNLFPVAESGDNPPAMPLSAMNTESDLEFGTVMGILGENDLKLIDVKQTQLTAEDEPRERSFLRQFFPCTGNAEASQIGSCGLGKDLVLGSANTVLPQQVSPVPDIGELKSDKNSILKKLFENAPCKQLQTTMPSMASIRGMHLEEIERTLRSQSNNRSVLAAAIPGSAVPAKPVQFALNKWGMDHAAHMNDQMIESNHDPPMHTQGIQAQQPHFKPSHFSEQRTALPQNDTIFKQLLSTGSCIPSTSSYCGQQLLVTSSGGDMIQPRLSSESNHNHRANSVTSAEADLPHDDLYILHSSMRQLGDVHGKRVNARVDNLTSTTFSTHMHPLTAIVPPLPVGHSQIPTSVLRQMTKTNFGGPPVTNRPSKQAEAGHPAVCGTSYHSGDQYMQDMCSSTLPFESYQMLSQKNPLISSPRQFIEFLSSTRREQRYPIEGFSPLYPSMLHYPHSHMMPLSFQRERLLNTEQYQPSNFQMQSCTQNQMVNTKSHPILAPYQINSTLQQKIFNEHNQFTSSSAPSAHNFSSFPVQANQIRGVPLIRSAIRPEIINDAPSTLPSIINSLPPSANYFSVNDLEQQYR